MNEKELLRGFVAVLVVVTMMVAMPATQVQAYSIYTAETTSSEGFSKSWKKTEELHPMIDPAIGDDWGVLITYGYTWGLFSKKDYVKDVGGQPAAVESCGYVQNSSGVRKYTNPVKGARLTGKITVNHTGSSVRYGIVIQV